MKLTFQKFPAGVSREGPQRAVYVPKVSGMGDEAEAKGLAVAVAAVAVTTASDRIRERTRQQVECSFPFEGKRQF